MQKKLCFLYHYEPILYYSLYKNNYYTWIFYDHSKVEYPLSKKILTKSLPVPLSWVQETEEGEGRKIAESAPSKNLICPWFK